MSTFLIAEAGVNHGGSLEKALELADAAKWAGADAVKYQLFSSQRLWGDDRIKHLELSYRQMKDIAAYCKSINLEFMCTPFGVEELEFLTPMLERIKIASGCLHRVPLMKAAIATKLPLILSTGMNSGADILAALIAVNYSHGEQRPAATLLHCTSSYPCRLEDANLKVITEMQSSGWTVGYSDHTNGITVAIAAVALGAVMIEKHLTIDRNAEGPDHKSSITPKELKALRIALIEVEAALGDGVKKVLPCEVELRKAWRD